MKQLSALVFCLFALTANAQLSNGLIAYYPFNNGNTDNQAPTAFSTLFAQQTTPTANALGAANQALAFSGSAPQLWVSSSGLIDFGLTTSFSFVTDFKSGSAATQEFFGDLLINGHGWQIGFFNSTGYVTFETGAGATSISVHTTTVYNDLAWHQVALLVDKASLNVKMYVDNQLQTLEGTVCGTSVSATAVDISGCNFNANEDNDQLTDFGNGLQGALDEIRLYGRLLTESEVAQTYTLSFGGGLGMSEPPGLPVTASFDPLSGQLTITPGIEDAHELTVMDSQGRILAQRTIRTTARVDLGASSGLYIVRLVRNGRSWMERCIVAR